MDRPWTPADRRLSELVGSYWLHFAATGDPNAPGLPTWPAYDLHTRPVMVLGEHPVARTLPDEAHLRFWEEAFR
jgi:carboxylesterase type B